MVARTSRIMAVALISVLVAALITGILYIVLVLASIFVTMPTAARNVLVVGGVLTVIFTGTFLIAFRHMTTKNNL